MLPSFAQTTPNFHLPTPNDCEPRGILCVLLSVNSKVPSPLLPYYQHNQRWYLCCPLGRISGVFIEIRNNTRPRNK